MSLSDKEAHDRIKDLVSRNESFSDVDKELMQAKHSTWEQVLNKANHQRHDQPTDEGEQS